jgi:hypothetical protein
VLDSLELCLEREEPGTSSPPEVPFFLSLSLDLVAVQCSSTGQLSTAVLDFYIRLSLKQPEETMFRFKMLSDHQQETRVPSRLKTLHMKARYRCKGIKYLMFEKTVGSF